VYLRGFFALQSAVGNDATGEGERVSKAEGSVNSSDDGNKFDGKNSDYQWKKRKNRCAVCRKKVGLTGGCHICHQF
jgi:hypothetical protein